LGTVAGDDTLVVIVAEGTSGADMSDLLASMAGLR
jgi:arginine repressor